MNKFQFVKKHIASLVTGARILFSLPLILIPFPSTRFYVFYLLCGLSDMIDGTIARRTETVSKFGARLDTAADFIFMLVCSVRILPHIHPPVWLWMWIAAIALIKILHTAAVLICKKRLLSIHSVLNKITGFALLLLPLTLTFVEVTYIVLAICVLATVAVSQEIYLVKKGREVV